MLGLVLVGLARALVRDQRLGQRELHRGRDRRALLVDGLEQLGYLERRPDPSDGRAKLICLTELGWQAIREGRRLIAEIEVAWADALGDGDFESLCRDLQRLLDVLDPTVRAQYFDTPQ